MKLTDKQIFIIKSTLGIMFALNAGEKIGYAVASVSVVPFVYPFFIRTFFYLICVLIVQWILFLEFLPKRWFLNGIIGIIISALLIEILFPLFPFNPPSGQFYVVDATRYLLMGLVAAIPQGILLKKQGYLWILLNTLGWALNHIYVSLLIYPVFSVVPFYFVMLISITNGVWLGLMLSFYLYKIKNGEHEQNLE